MSDLDSEYYDIDSARNKLTNISEYCHEFSKETGRGIQLVKANLSEIFVQEYASPASWRLTRFNEELNENEIVEFRVQGVISDKLLPPIGNLMSKAAKQCFHLRQSVAITGLGSPAFDDVIPMIRQIFYMFLQRLPEDALEMWEGHQVRGYDAISTQTRLFTSTKASTSEAIPFDALVDSNNNLSRLARLASGQFIHTSDNEVEYLGPIDGDRSNRTGNVSPEVFRVGDIVDLSVSFVAWPCGRGKFRMGIQLKSMRLLDKEETNVARMKIMFDNSQKKTAKFALPKRRKTYTREEETAEAQFRMSKMKIIEGTTQIDDHADGI